MCSLRSLSAAIVPALMVVVLLVLAVTDGGAGTPSASPATAGKGPLLDTPPQLESAPAATAAGETGEAPAAADPDRVEPVRRLGAVVTERTELRRTPSENGKVVTMIKTRTKFGSKNELAVVARKGEWLGVLHQAVAGGKAGWIKASAARLEERPYEIVVNRAKLRATVLHDGKVVTQFKVGVGRAGHKTPVGRYAITDSLKGFGPYGCCILAITARQPNLPQGWSGGDRIAFHGGPSWRVGIRTTTGCMTVRDTMMRKLIRRIHLGTRVTIKA